MENPYWHPEVKPHSVDTESVRALLFEIYNLITTSPDHSSGFGFGQLAIAQGRAFWWRGRRGLPELGIAGTGSGGARSPGGQGDSLAARADRSARLSW